MKDYHSFYTDLEKLISINTTFSSPENGFPFGRQTATALEFFLTRAKEMGFETINYDNYAGEVYFGEGEEIGIIGHLDVVPEGDGWRTNPYQLSEKDGVLYGRGVMDDKLPTLLILYTLNEIKNSGVKVNKRFRLFVGCNEETGWKDLEYLTKRTTLPDYGFSPDGDFPVSYAEKGIFIIEVRLPNLKNFSSLCGGTVVNAVCAHASAVCKENTVDKNKLTELGLTLENGNEIHSYGVAAHGSQPQRGKNALKPLFEYFLSQGESVQNILDYLFYDKGGINKLVNEQGATTLSPDLLCEENGVVKITCDCRLPAPFTVEQIETIFKNSGLDYTITEKHPPMLVEKDGWFVNALISAYNTVTGANATPVSMGGSTFARAFKYGCAFGMDFLESDSHIHDANEQVSVADVLRAYEIYKTAVLNLLK